MSSDYDNLFSVTSTPVSFTNLLENQPHSSNPDPGTIDGVHDNVSGTSSGEDTSGGGIVVSGSADASEVFRADGRTFITREELVDYLDRKTRNEREQTLGVKTQRLRPSSTRPPTVYPEVWNHMPEDERAEQIAKFEAEYFPKRPKDVAAVVFDITDIECRNLVICWEFR